MPGFTQEYNPFTDLKQFMQEELTRLKQELRKEHDLEGIETPIKIEEAAEITGYSVAYIRKMCSSPERYIDPMPFKKKLGRVFFFKSDLVEWIKGQGNENSSDEEL